MAPVRSYVRCDYTCDLSASPSILGAEGGSFVVAGHGWRQGVATSGEFHRVHLELHKGVPPLDLDGWGDVLEAPYGSGTGWVGTGTLFGEEDDTHLELAGRGMYRVRVSRRAAEDDGDPDDGDEFRFQFWPMVAGQAGPRQLARDPRSEFVSWRQTDGFVGADLRAVLWWMPRGSGRFSVRKLAAFTLLPEADVATALRAEVGARRLRVEGDLGEVTGQVDADPDDNPWRRRHRAVVQLPPPMEAAQIPRRSRPAAPPEDRAEPDAARPTSNLVFDDERGNKILARTGDGRSVMVMPAPLSPYARPGRVRIFSTAGHLPPVGAAGRVGKAFVLVTVLPGGTELLITTFGADPDGLAGNYPFDAGDEPFLPRPDAPLGDVGHDVCLGLSATIDGFGVQQDWSGVRSFGGWRVRTSFGHGGVYAYEQDGGWDFRATGSEGWDPRPAAGDRLVGVTGAGGPGALVIDPDGTSVSRIGRGDRRTRLCAYGEPILDAVVSGRQPIFAVRTASGAVAVHHCVTGLPLWHLGPPEARTP